MRMKICVCVYMCLQKHLWNYDKTTNDRNAKTIVSMHICKQPLEWAQRALLNRVAAEQCYATSKAPSV